MTCPSCQSQLTVSERHGIEVDICPRCRGVWLDRGELDKILEREAHFVSSAYGRGAREDDDRGEQDRKQPGRRSLWRDLFD